MGESMTEVSKSTFNAAVSNGIRRTSKNLLYSPLTENLRKQSTQRIILALHTLTLTGSSTPH